MLTLGVYYTIIYYTYYLILYSSPLLIYLPFLFLSSSSPLLFPIFILYVSVLTYTYLYLILYSPLLLIYHSFLLPSFLLPIFPFSSSLFFISSSPLLIYSFTILSFILYLSRVSYSYLYSELVLRCGVIQDNDVRF